MPKAYTHMVLAFAGFEQSVSSVPLHFNTLLNFLEQLRTGVDSAFTCHSLKRQEILYQHRAHGVFVCRSKEPS